MRAPIFKEHHIRRQLLLKLIMPLHKGSAGLQAGEQMGPFYCSKYLGLRR